MQRGAIDSALPGRIDTSTKRREKLTGRTDTVANIQERTTDDGKVRYRVQVRLKGYPPQTATFERKTDAKEWAQRTEADMKAGRHIKTVEAKRHTVGEMIDRYVRYVIPTKKENSRGNQTRQLLWWRERLGRYLLSDVTPALISEARDELLQGTTQSKRPRSPSTVVRYMAALSHTFSVAVRDWGWLDDSPMRKVRKPREPRGRTRFLSEEEMALLLAACRQSRNRYLQTIVVIALSTALRQGEILNLSWDRVDLERGVIKLLPDQTKNYEARSVPLVGRARDMLRELARVRRIDTNLVFPGPFRPGVQPRPIKLRQAWDAAVERAGLKDFRFHDLRHTAASYLAMSGATLAEISEVLGHKTLQMVKRYAHLTESHTSKVVEKMNQVMFG